MKYCIDDFSPCTSCLTKECGLVDGNECEKCNDFLKIKSKFYEQEKELNVTREYISRNNLEWDLLSFSIRED